MATGLTGKGAIVEPMTRRPIRATRAEIRRAVEAAKEAGVQMAVEILPNGTIRLIPSQGIGDLPTSLRPGLVL